MGTDLLQSGAGTLVVAAAGGAMVLVALGLWLVRDVRRPALLLAAGGVAVALLSVVVGWIEESRDVDRLRGELQERGVTVSLDEARDVREALKDEGEYSSAVGAAQPWRLRVQDDRLVLEAY
ncbi:hypothetical protein [Aeromicrobium sp. IC_218]|uniref:hypothetical protein n=1 Tax=Aeromicrobium sp. IC_218 TaxID=2545468 RepID=UPI00103EAE31|nr:hypothetical protein [Aeromicrobium sp. IC_218]TCJ00652.1 hypothetical protein E0W78_00745 [Aeromicrobium sp. IC_218]